MKLKRLLQTALALLLTVALAGCGLVRVNEEKNEKIVVAEVNGEKIYKGAFLKEWERALIRNGGSIPEEQQQEVKENILEGLIQQELIMQKAKAAGFEVTDEIMDEARSEYEKEIEDYARQLQAEAKIKEQEEQNTDTEADENTDNEGATNADTNETAAETASDNSTENTGTASDNEADKTAAEGTAADETAAEETAAENNDDNTAGDATGEDGTAATDTAAAETAQNDTEDGSDKDNGTAEEETEAEEPVEQKYIDQAKVEYKEWFEMMKLTEDEYIDLIARGKVMESFMKDQTKELTVEEKEIKDFYDKALKDQRENPGLLSYGSYYFPVIVLKTPESRTVKHILVKIPDEAKQEITKLRNDNKEEDADKLLEEKLAEIEQKASEVLAKAKAGEDFEQLIETYGEDPGMKDEAYKDGYVVYRDGMFVKSFEDKAFELEKDEVSELVASDNGYHIIKLYKSTEEEVIPMKELTDDIKETLLSQKQNTKWGEIVEDWMGKATIKRYKKKL